MREFQYAAAGGVLADGRRVLVLRRPARGQVRLPKGHVDPGETAEEAALREVGEETGYVDLERVADLGAQIVTFPSRLSNTVVTRHERYFLMRLRSDRTAPRPMEDWEFDPIWVAWDEAESMLTFEPEREWLRRGLRIWREMGEQG